MPVVSIDWFAGRTSQQKAALAEALTKAFGDIAQVPADHVWIIFRDVPKSEWAIGGKLVEPPKP